MTLYKSLRATSAVINLKTGDLFSGKLYMYTNFNFFRESVWKGKLKGEGLIKIHQFCLLPLSRLDLYLVEIPQINVF